MCEGRDKRGQVYLQEPQGAGSARSRTGERQGGNRRHTQAMEGTGGLPQDNKSDAQICVFERPRSRTHWHQGRSKVECGRFCLTLCDIRLRMKAGEGVSRLHA